MNFDLKQKNPTVGLAPMDGVTDMSFRLITKKHGNPDIMFTEFVNVEAICLGSPSVLDKLMYCYYEKPLIAQIYGKTPDFFRECAILICELGFDGIDINMGCPSKSVTKSGSGASLIKQPKLAIQIIDAVMKGVDDFFNYDKRIEDCNYFKPKTINKIRLLKRQIQNFQLPKWFEQNKIKTHISNQKLDKKNVIPISIKTRTGIDKHITQKWLSTLLKQKPNLVTLHGRTLKQSYKGQADWQQIALAKQLAIKLSKQTQIWGNGDVQNKTQALKKCQQYNLDGILIGRASMGNPWCFNKDSAKDNIDNRKKIALEHARLFEYINSHKDKYNFFPMRKHLAWYIKNFGHAKKIRTQLVLSNNSTQVKNILDQI